MSQNARDNLDLTFDMKRYYSFLLLAVLSVSSVLAQKPDVTEANIRRHITYLASDALEGRRTGEKGASLAADYIAKEFAKLKLKPGGSKNGRSPYMQEYPYVTGVELTKENNTLHIEAAARTGSRSSSGRSVGGRLFSECKDQQRSDIVRRLRHRGQGPELRRLLVAGKDDGFQGGRRSRI